MSFQPIIPMSGYVGWRFLENTRDQQVEQLASTSVAQRDEAYFRENIAKIASAEDLVSDRRLLRVALTAFGLENDLPNKAFVQRILDSPINDPKALTNRLADKRYKEFADAFGFGNPASLGPSATGFADRLIEKYQTRSFELAVGEQDDSMRLALALERELQDLAEKPVSEKTRWLTVLGTPNLRAVFEKAFQLPTAFGTLDLDRQIDVLQERTERLTGEDTIEQFASKETIERLTRQFFLSEQLSEIQTMSSADTAIILLQQTQTSMRSFNAT